MTSGFGFGDFGYAVLLCDRFSPNKASAIAYVSGPGFITGTGSASAKCMWAWCMVVEPKTITSAPSVSMHCSASSVRAGKMSDSFPVSRLGYLASYLMI